MIFVFEAMLSNSFTGTGRKDFGSAGDLAVPGDYDGDGKTDPGVFRPTENTWYINRTNGGLLIAGFGSTGDAPIPNTVVP